MFESTFDIFMIVLLIIELIFTLILYMASRTKYNEMIEPLEKEEYSLKKFLPIGLFIIDKLDYKFAIKYDQKILRKISMVYGTRYAQYYLKVHLANKIVYMILTLIITSFFGFAADVSRRYLAFSFLLIIAVFFLNDSMLNEKSEKRILQLKIEFPDFLTKLTLLIGAGMTIRNAWQKIVEDSNSDTPLYKELRQVLLDMEAGSSEVKAYEDFADRAKIKEISNFIGILIQNLKMGGTQFTFELKRLGNECWIMRKNTAIRFGEKASAKLIIPMMIMFVAILIIVMTPAILAFKGM